tara:strand:- start:1223 stop:1651 length:429 start_codon:yes stop_codon:yes gene_type:complete
MKKSTTILFLLTLCLGLSAQDFDNYVLDDDTICGIVQIDCSSKYGRHLFDSENMNHDDSLSCLQISYLPLQNSNKVLCLEQNFFGDTLAIGLRKEIVVKKQGLFHIRTKSDRLNSSYTSCGDKIGEWHYFFPDGKLKEKIKY